MNPYTGEPYTALQKKKRLARAKLPAASPLVLKQLESAYKSDVIVCRAGTGTGKGVVIAPYFMDKRNIEKGKLQPVSFVMVAEPRTENCVSIANFLRESIIGAPVVQYAFRDNNKIDQNTRMAFVTYGFLVNYFYNDKYLRDYDVLIIDEVHERDKDTDILLTYAKEYFLYPNYNEVPGIKRDRKVVILSATMDPEYYRKYYTEGTPYSATIVDIPGKTNPIEHIFLQAERDVVMQSLQILKQIKNDPYYMLPHEVKKSLTEEQIKGIKEGGSAIIFMSGLKDLKKGCQLVGELNKSQTAWKCYEYSSKTNSDDKYELAHEDKFRETKVNGKDPERKIIFSTNAAESGVTINGITYVIESGQRKENVFNDAEEMDELRSTFITRSEATQRCGRSGRLGFGVCYHLYTQKQWDDEFQEYKAPALLTMDITDILLKMIYKIPDRDDPEPVKTVTQFLSKMPAPPTQKQIDFALRWLKKLDLLGTELGRSVANIALEVPMAITMLCAKIIGREYDVAPIVGMYDAEKKLMDFFRIDSDNPRAKQEYGRWADKRGEIYAAADLFAQYRKSQNKSDFCYKYFLHESKMAKAVGRYQKILQRMREWTVPPELRDSFRGENISDCFAHGFKLNVAKFNGRNYDIDRPVGSVDIEANEFVPKLSKKIVFMSIMKMSNGYAINGIINL
jgi:HrpA-like RNA helicase